MKKYFISLVIGFLTLFMVACGNQSENQNQVDEDGVPKILEVELVVQETADVNETIPLLAYVTQGDEKIIDADEVEFEIWEEGKKSEGQMIEATNENDGSYSAEVTFDRDGLFNVQVHVTARGMHTMPKSTVIVGDGPTEEHAHDHGHGDYHTEGFSMHFMKPNDAVSGEESTLTVHVHLHDEPLEELRVRYEIWNNEVSEAHDWIDAEEVSPGEYVSNYTFKESGSYMIQIHVEDSKDLHEHEEHKVVVK